MKNNMTVRRGMTLKRKEALTGWEYPKICVNLQTDVR